MIPIPIITYKTNILIKCEYITIVHNNDIFNINLISILSEYIISLVLKAIGNRKIKITAVPNCNSTLKILKHIPDNEYIAET